MKQLDVYDFKKIKKLNLIKIKYNLFENLNRIIYTIMVVNFLTVVFGKILYRC
ncbi:hypothetical protein IPdc08_00074 [archaeon]|nr:hypothetical protein IPdc08_00074 [archaeon]